MSSVSYPPLLIEPEQLQPCLADPAVLIVDLSDPARYAAGHIPGAVSYTHLDVYKRQQLVVWSLTMPTACMKA